MLVWPKTNCFSRPFSTSFHPQLKKKKTKKSLKSRVTKLKTETNDDLSFECAITEDLQHIVDSSPEDKQEEIGRNNSLFC